MPPGRRGPGSDDDREDKRDPLRPRGRTQVSAAFGLEQFVAAAAILEDGRREFLERRLIDNPGLGGGDILGEFVEAGVESGRSPAARWCRRRSMDEMTYSVKAMGKPT
jgi:hypothetical protein